MISYGEYQLLHPDELEQIKNQSPIAYLPLGTYEHHCYHLPVGFDGIKAHALCMRAAEITGGVVMPCCFFGTGGGHIGTRWTHMWTPEELIPLIAQSIDMLVENGFKRILLFTGHYPFEQVDMVKQIASDAQARHACTRVIGICDCDVTTPLPGDSFAGDHAAKYETSIALELNPDWVRMNYLYAHDSSVVTLPITPIKNDGGPYDPTSPLYAMHGVDPRIHASKELGQKLVDEIVRRTVELLS
ncbi:MAG: creatininase family protein [Armatimonadota bacterium]